MKVEKELFGDENKGVTAKETLYKYLSYWPLFLICLFVCVAAGVFYVRYAEPKYLASTLILANNSDSKTKTKDDLIENALSGNVQQNNDIVNQIRAIQTSPVIERVVSKNSFNISYYYVGEIKKTEIYLDAPFRLIPQNIPDLSTPFVARISNLTSEGGTLQHGSDIKGHRYNFRWNVPFRNEGKVFILTPKGNVSDFKDDSYLTIWKPVKESAAEILDNLKVALTDKNTSIIKLELVTANMMLGKDILNSIYKEFNMSDIEERNIVSQNTIRFIDDRLAIMAKELSGVEGNLENYQGQNRIINVETQSSQSFQNANDVSKDLTGVNVKQGVVNMIQSYFNSPNNQDRLVPSTLGLEDPTLSSLISKYNELQIKKQREAPLVTAASTVMKDLNNQLTDMRGSILELLQNLNKNLSFQEKNLEQQNSEYHQFLSSLPRKERVMQEIKRKQGITEELYLYLLKKREESAISSATTHISNFKQIEPATALGPIEPKATNITLYTVLLGIFLPLAIIYLKDLMNDKVVTRYDIAKKVDAPILGDVVHIARKKTFGVAVLGREIIAEQFRIIRTNLSMLSATKESSTFLITSSGEDEGKTLVSLNLAAVLAMPGKKVALLEFDLRKPGITKKLKLDNTKGIVDYLNGNIQQTSRLLQVSEDIPTLHFYSSGIVDAHPGDLLLNSNTRKLFEELKKEYDYIVIDSAPATLVGDAFILGQFSDASIYIVRQRKTVKKQLEFINDIVAGNRLNNMSVIFNDVKSGGKYGYYGYGTTAKSGYYSTENFKAKPRISWNPFAS